MLDRPAVAMTLVLCNIVILAGSLIMGVGVLPRLRQRWNLTLVSGTAFFLFNGAQHLDVTLGMLFSDDPSGVGTTWHLVALRVLVALSLTVFIFGIYRDVREWKSMQDKAK